MPIQVITSPSGERMIVLPEAEYEELLDRIDDAVDALAYDEIKRKLAAGEEEFVPAEFVYRMLESENPVALWREFRGLSSKQLAEASGITPAYLSQIESGKREGSLGTIKKIAEALKVGIDDLV